MGVEEGDFSGLLSWEYSWQSYWGWPDSWGIRKRKFEARNDTIQAVFSDFSSITHSTSSSSGVGIWVIWVISSCLGYFFPDVLMGIYTAVTAITSILQLEIAYFSVNKI